MRWCGALLLTAVTGIGCSGQTPSSPPTDPTAPAQKGLKSPTKPITPTPPKPAKTATEPSKPLDPAQSTSIGSVLEGRLQGGAQLPARAPGMLHNPNKDRSRAYGTVEVVQAIVRAAKSLAHRPPQEHILINDLSYANGGPIDGHASHRAGRDMDFYFPLRTKDKTPFPGKLIPLDPNGIGYDYKDLTDPSDDIEVHLDLERTWDFLSALLQDKDAHVQVIYLVAHVQSALAQHAKSRGVPPEQIADFLEHSCQPKGAPHDDHGHIRFYCSAQDIRAGCQDNAPIDRKQKARLRRAGVSAVIARPKARAARKVKTTSARQARKKAGKLHPSVADFLDARRVWSRNIPKGPARCR